MKKIIVALLMTAMISSLAACGGKDQTGTDAGTSASSEISATQEKGSATGEASADTEETYVPGEWDGNVYKNTSLGMSLTLPEGWQIGTQEDIDAVENAGQQVTGNTAETEDVSNDDGKPGNVRQCNSQTVCRNTFRTASGISGSGN